MKITLTVVLVVILSLVINISSIHTNRLKSDSTHFQENLQETGNVKERCKVLMEAKEDHYRNEYGYVSDNGKYHLDNLKEDYEVEMVFDLFSHLPEFKSRIYLETDNGGYYYGDLPKSDWIHDDSIAEWDGETLKVDMEDEDVSFMWYEFQISENNTYEFDNIYKLDYFVAIPNEEWQSPNNGKVKILVKMRNNSVVGYTILNPNINNYEYLVGYDLNGLEVFKVVKNYEERLVRKLLGSNILFIESTGHLISLSFPEMLHLNLNVSNPLFTEININEGEDIQEFEGTEDLFLEYDEDLEGVNKIEILTFEAINEEESFLSITDLELNLKHIIQE